MFKSLLKAVVDVTLLPIDIAKDSISLGGVSDGRDKSYTAERLGRVETSLKFAYGELDKSKKRQGKS